MSDPKDDATQQSEAAVEETATPDAPDETSAESGGEGTTVTDEDEDESDLDPDEDDLEDDDEDAEEDDDEEDGDDDPDEAA